VYIRQPLGFSDGTSKVCHLKRCLNGLHVEAARELARGLHGAVPSRVQHAAPCMARRPWLTTMRFRPVHLHLPHRSRLRHDRIVRR
jgi:hypothetical protein